MKSRLRRGVGAFARLARPVVRFGVVAAVVYGLLGFFTARISAGPAELLEVSPTSPSGLAAPGAIWRVEPASEAASDWVAARGVELRGAISVHSGRSHDAVGTFAEIGEAAEKAQLDFVILGDHPSAWLEAPGALDPVVLGSTVVIPGQEMVIEGKGRALVVGLDADTLVQRWEGEVADLADRVEKVDGFISVVHARSPRGRERWQVGVDAPGVHAWEVIDMSEVARLRLADRWAPYHITSFLVGLVTGTSHRPVLRLNRERARAPGLLAYDSARSRETLTLTAALNHHPKARIAGRLVPSYSAFFRTFTNHVLVPEAPGTEPWRARERVLGGLKASHAYVSLGRAAEAAGFHFGALPTTSGGSEPLAVRLPPDAPGKLLVRILRDGDEQGWFSATAGEIVAFQPAGDGAYRVEVYRAGIPLGSRRYAMTLWLLSSAVDVGPAPGGPTTPG